MATKITGDLYYVGADHPDLRVFDIIMYTPFGSTYNAYLIKGKDKNVLIETVKEKFYNQMIEKIDSVLSEGETIDYIIHNHTEPDHSGSSYRILKEKFPEAEIIASEIALKYLKEIGNEEVENMKTIAAEDLKSLDIGGYTLEFFNAPFLHWPDTIFTYCQELKTLFTCDFLGSHYSLGDGKVFDKEVPSEEMEGFDEAFKYYYDCIFGPFKRFVLDGLNIIKDLQDTRGVDFIGTSHGPVLSDPSFIEDCLEKYQGWSVGYDKALDHKKITVLYVSAYGYTAEMAEEIIRGLESEGFNVKSFDVTFDDEAEIAAEMSTSIGVLFGTSTILGDALANIYTLAVKYVNPILSMGQFGGTFGSYGWSGEGPGNIHERLAQCKLNLPMDPLKVNFRPSGEDRKACFDWGKTFGSKITKCLSKTECEVEGEKKFRCTVCGFEESGQTPSEVCEVCAATGDIWDLVCEEKKERKWKCTICGYEEEGIEHSDPCPLCAASGDIWEDLGPVENEIEKKEEKEPIKSEEVHKWRCTVCGYVEEGVEPSDPCPVCAASGDIWEDLGPVEEEQPKEEAIKSEEVHKWRCTVCGYVEEGVEPSDPCPVCAASGDIWEDLGPVETETKKEKSIKGGDDVHKWRCTVCGFQEEGVEPSDMCEVCRQSGDIWEDLGPVNAKESLSDWKGTIAIVGGCAAGVSAAFSAREVNEDCDILLFSEEGIPYNRIQLTKALGQPSPIYGLEKYQEANISLIEEKVIDICENKKNLKTESGEKYSFDRLVLAVGSNAVNPFGEYNNLFTIRTANDMKRFNDLNQKENVVLIGGGVIGMEICDLLQTNEGVKKLTIIELEDHLLKGYLDSDFASSLVEKKLIDEGIDLHLKTRFKEFLTNGGFIERLVVEDPIEGEKIIKADAVVVAVSTLPDTDFLKKLSIPIEKNGIVVNNEMRTIDENIFAAGDCAFAKDCVVSPKNWGSAVYQGTIAGMNAAGMNEICQGPPSTYSIGIGDLDVITTGRSSFPTMMERTSENDYLRIHMDENEIVQRMICVGPQVGRGIVTEGIGKSVVDVLGMIRKIFPKL